jgi:uncharacterized protein YkwD
MTRSGATLGFTTALLLAAAVIPLSRAGADDTATTGPDLAALEVEAAERINVHREASKLAPFTYDKKVAKIARRHSEFMAKGKVKFVHDGLNDRVQEAAKLMDVAGMAENVSRHQRSSDFAEMAVTKWLASPVHRTNIDGDYGLTGVGAALSAEGVVYFTQIFVKVRGD